MEDRLKKEARTLRAEKAGLELLEAVAQGFRAFASGSLALSAACTRTAKSFVELRDVAQEALKAEREEGLR